MQASGLAAQVQPPHRLGGAHKSGARYSSRRAPLNILSQVCFGPSRLHAADTAASPTRRRPQAWRSLFFAPWTSLCDCAISRRTVMN